MKTGWMRARSVVFALGLALLASCSSRSAQEPEAAGIGQPGVDVGSITVTLAPSLEADAKTVFDEVNGTIRLKAAVEGILTKVGRLKPGSPRAMEVEVTDFRLRSGATVFWVGIMAGVDILDVTVTVRDGSQIVRQFSTGVGSSGIAGGLSSSSRFQPMADVVADRVAEQL